MGVPISCEVASAVVLEDGAEVPRMLLLKRAKAHLQHEWCHVAGGIEAGETAWQAALREIAEETGLAAINSAVRKPNQTSRFSRRTLPIT